MKSVTFGRMAKWNQHHILLFSISRVVVALMLLLAIQAPALLDIQSKTVKVFLEGADSDMETESESSESEESPSTLLWGISELLSVLEFTSAAGSREIRAWSQHYLSVHPDLGTPPPRQGARTI